MYDNNEPNASLSTGAPTRPRPVPVPPDDGVPPDAAAWPLALGMTAPPACPAGRSFTNESPAWVRAFDDARELYPELGVEAFIAAGWDTCTAGDGWDALAVAGRVQRCARSLPRPVWSIALRRDERASELALFGAQYVAKVDAVLAEVEPDAIAHWSAWLAREQARCAL